MMSRMLLSRAMRMHSSPIHEGYALMSVKAASWSVWAKAAYAIRALVKKPALLAGRSISADAV